MEDYFQTLDKLAGSLIRDNATAVDEHGDFPRVAIEALSARRPAPRAG